MNDKDLELLEMYIDGELSAAETQAMRQRLAQETSLAAELEQLQSQRSVRQSYFASLEPTQAEAMDVAARVQRKVRRSDLWLQLWRSARYISAAAACVAAGLLIGWYTRPSRLVSTVSSTNGAPGATQPAVVYHVAITDDAGRVLGVQRFDDLERAREFSSDLERDQDRLQQLRNGQVTIRSARF